MKHPYPYLFPFLLVVSLPLTSQAATILEDWQFSEEIGTQFSGLVNSAGSAKFSGDKAQVTTDGSGALGYTIGSATNDNVFRNATLTNPNVTSGQYELNWTILSATMAGGDASGANVSFGMRDGGVNSDLFIVRLQRQNDRLLLQTRVGTNNTVLDNFGSAITTLPDALAIRVVADFDADTFDVFWTLGAGAESSATGIAFSAPGLEFDQVRLTANTNTNDWGVTDSVKIDFLTLSVVPEPGTTSLLGLLALAALLRRGRVT